MSKPKVEIINPRDLRPGPEFRRPVFDSSAVQRADQALEAMSATFEEWLSADVSRLLSARQASRAAQWSDTSLQTLFSVSHDLKGMGGTYGYPLVTEIAASLCRLIETDAGKQEARRAPQLTNAHVDAINAAVRDHVTSREHPVGRALLMALESEVARRGFVED